MKKIKSIAASLGLAIATLALTAHMTLAAPVTIPAGLNPGDTYRIAFVTSTTRDATSTNIADYNAFVTAAANSQASLAALGTIWTAIASTSTVSARDNTSTVPSSVVGGSTGVPIFLLNDTQLAGSYDTLWSGTLDNSLSIDETGETTTGSGSVWTGTTPAGLTEFAFGLGVTTIFGARLGDAFATGGSWTALGVSETSFEFQLYSLSGLLTVPSESVSIPAPGSLSLLALGLAGLGFARRRRIAKTAS